MNLAAIEIGTNSTKMIIIEKLDGGGYTTLIKKSDVNRLSQKMYGGNIINQESMDKGLKIIGQFISEIKENDAELIEIFSTSVLRDASNSLDFIEKVKTLYGYEINIITGEQEANLAYKSCCSNIKDNNPFAIIDIGGGSTEIIIATLNGITQKVSIDIGAVRLTEMFVKSDPISSEDIKAITNYISEKFKQIRFSIPNKINLIGTGGTIKSIGTMNMNLNFKSESMINGTKVTKDSITKFFDDISEKNIEERMKVAGLNPKRADVIEAGFIILLYVMNNFEINEITISSVGVLEGFIENHLTK